jgi:hypothetical protein
MKADCGLESRSDSESYANRIDISSRETKIHALDGKLPVAAS